MPAVGQMPAHPRTVPAQNKIMEATMSITGRVNLINDPTAFFLPIVLGTGKPTSGFAPSRGTGFVVRLTGLLLGIFPISLTADVNTTNGDFTLPDFPTGLPGLNDVWINLTAHGRPFYRSERFPLAHTKESLQIYVYQPTIPSTDGVTAGQISTGLGGTGLPGNTTLSANPWGLGVVGSKSGADIQFGIQLIPDITPNLSIFFDLALDGWNIHVGWPADWCTSADDILNSIRSALQTSGSKANQLVSGTITKAFEGPPLNLSPTITQKVLDNVAIQFVTMSLPTKHTWALSNQGDKTIVVVPQLTLGYPRAF
jgi:hypothetical protein